MVNAKIVGFAVSVLFFIGIIASLGGPVVGDTDIDTDDLIPQNGFFTQTSIDVPLINFTITFPNPAPLGTAVANFLDLYQQILNESGVIVKFVVVLMMFLLSYEISISVLRAVNTI